MCDTIVDISTFELSSIAINNSEQVTEFIKPK